MKFKKLRKDPKNKDVSAEETKTAINHWKLFYKDHITIDCNKSEEDTINDIMASSAGLKGWSESSYDIKSDSLTTNTFSVLTNEDTEEDEEEDEDEERRRGRRRGRRR